MINIPMGLCTPAASSRSSDNATSSSVRCPSKVDFEKGTAHVYVIWVNMVVATSIEHSLYQVCDQLHDSRQHDRLIITPDLLVVQIISILSHVYEESRGLTGSSRCMHSFWHGIYKICLPSILTRSINCSPNAVQWYGGLDSFVNHLETRAAMATVKSVIDVIEQDPFAGVVLHKALNTCLPVRHLSPSRSLCHRVNILTGSSRT